MIAIQMPIPARRFIPYQCQTMPNINFDIDTLLLVYADSGFRITSISVAISGRIWGRGFHKIYKLKQTFYSIHATFQYDTV